MRQIYRVTVRGRMIESADLRWLLARAVVEKRAMDRRFQLFLSQYDLHSAPDAKKGDLRLGGIAASGFPV